MRGFDTNLLVRFVTRDDPRQWRIVHDLVAAGEAQSQRFHINTIVLCELVWVLVSPPYRLDRSEVVALLDGLLSTPTFEVQARHRVRRALDAYRDGAADFADYLIGEENHHAGCSDTATFDKQLKSATGFTVL